MPVQLHPSGQPNMEDENVVTPVGEDSSSPNAVPSVEEESSPPNAVPPVGEDSSSPNAVPSVGEESSPPNAVPPVGEDSSSPNSSPLNMTFGPSSVGSNNETGASTLFEPGPVGNNNESGASTLINSSSEMSGYGSSTISDIMNGIDSALWSPPTPPPQRSNLFSRVLTYGEDEAGNEENKSKSRSPPEAHFSGASRKPLPSSVQKLLPGGKPIGVRKPLPAGKPASKGKLFSGPPSNRLFFGGNSSSMPPPSPKPGHRELPVLPKRYDPTGASLPLFNSPMSMEFTESNIRNAITESNIRSGTNSNSLLPSAMEDDVHMPDPRTGLPSSYDFSIPEPIYPTPIAYLTIPELARQSIAGLKYLTDMLLRVIPWLSGDDFIRTAMQWSDILDDLYHIENLNRSQLPNSRRVQQPRHGNASYAFTVMCLDKAFEFHQKSLPRLVLIDKGLNRYDIEGQIEDMLEENEKVWRFLCTAWDSDMKNETSGDSWCYGLTKWEHPKTKGTIINNVCGPDYPEPIGWDGGKEISFPPLPLQKTPGPLNGL